MFVFKNDIRMDKQNTYSDRGNFDFDIEDLKNNCAISNTLMMNFTKFPWGKRNT